MIQFENRFMMDDKMLKEYVCKVLLKKNRTKAILISAIALVLTLLYVFQGKEVQAAMFGTCFLFTFLVTVSSPYTMIKQIKEADRQIHKGKKI